MQKYLGPRYKVMASVGHIREMNRSSISINTQDRTYEPIYVISEDKVKVVNGLKDEFRRAEKVLLACDADREGEAIAFSIAQVLGIKNPRKIVFHEITERAIQNALKEEQPLNQDLINAQKSRAVLDKLIGYKISPLLWRSIGGKLSAGRVQSIALRLTVEKENEIQKQTKDRFYKIRGSFDHNLNGSLKRIKSQSSKTITTEDVKIEKEEQVIKFFNIFKIAQFILHSIEEKQEKREPATPFITSTLQKEAYNKLGMPIKETMRIAQKLYENGYITYMRTDSTILSNDALSSIKEYVTTHYGNQYYRMKQYKSKVKNAQEAHECIRPTSIERTSVDDIQFNRLYQLIWKRTVASQMQPAIYNAVKVNIIIQHNNKPLKYIFECNNKILVFDGFLKVYNYKNVEDEENQSETEVSDDIKKLIGIELAKHEIIANEEMNRLMGRYNEATLAEQLEKLGIGRPSTFVSMVTKIAERGYVEKKTLPGKDEKFKILTLNKENDISQTSKTKKVGKENNKLIPTAIGIKVNEYLTEHFGNIIDYQFTAEMEEDLDEISNGNKVWNKVIDDFYLPFNKRITELAKETGGASNQLIGNDNEGNFVSMKVGKFGKFLSITDKDGNKVRNVSIKEEDAGKITKENISEFVNKTDIIGSLNNMPIHLKNGQFGYYFRYDNKNFKVYPDFDKDNLDVERVKGWLEENKNKETIIGKYKILKGPYGFYLKHKLGKKEINIGIPKNYDIEELTEDGIKSIIKYKVDKLKETKSVVKK